jgi:hypothetical protein
LFLLICLVAAVDTRGALAADGEAIMKNGLSAIHFERSGGLFALGKPLAADVVFSPSSAVVRANGASRPMTDAELAIFERLDPARLREFAEARQKGPPSPGLPDDYQFDIVLTLTDGSTVRLTFHGQSLGELKAVPGLAELAAWVIAEIERIWAAR